MRPYKAMTAYWVQQIGLPNQKRPQRMLRAFLSSKLKL